MRALLVQPPFVQLNAPYPALNYLAAWLRGQGVECRVEDHSIELYRAIFSRSGLSRIFEEASRRREAGLLAAEGVDEVDRYLSYRGLYEAWIEPIVDYLAGGDPAFAHRLAAAVEFPRGARVGAFLESRDGRPGPEDSPLVASLVLEDLGDLIVHAVDPDFGTVHYGERLGRSRDDFGEVLEGLDKAWLMREIYRPMLRGRFAAMVEAGERPDILLVSLPFPGTLVGALSCAAEAREAFGSGLGVAFGGGYVSTELRGLRDPALFDFCTWLCFDAGYGSLAAILDANNLRGTTGLYRTMTRQGGLIVASGFPAGDLAAESLGCAGPDSPFPARVIQSCAEEARWKAVEAKALRETHPDWRDFDPSRYLRPLDSTNPMHRLWSASPWLKYRLAQGCYWRRCAFCDTELDYVASFVAAEIPSLLAAIEAASAKTGLFGIHFVDEALPMAALLSFAEANRERAASGKKQYHYWGNVRFDPSWTADRVELLAASGLVAVSGGIEVASEEGLAMTDKGFDLAGLVATLVALRRAGILVHAYLIYGFPGQDEASIVESAEFVRGLFATGLVDSAYWHRFVLTRHSRMMAEWKAGSRPALEPRDRGGAFAANDLEFAGEEAYEKYGESLDAALGSWIEGEGLDRHAGSWFMKGKSGRKPHGIDGVARVEELIAATEATLDRRLLPARGRAFWVAGEPVLGSSSVASGTLVWARRGAMECLALGDAGRAEKAAAAIAALGVRPQGMDLAAFRAEAGLD
ncbi:MAG: radical SAM protein, partial [Spirochaetota bacterium]